VVSHFQFRFLDKIIISNKILNDVGKDVGKDVGNVTNNVTNNRSELILDLIKRSPLITTIQIAESLSVSKRTVLRDIDKLKQLDQLKRIGNEKSGHWQILN